MKTDQARRKINVEVYPHHNHLLLIHVENTFDGKIQQENNVFQSSKRSGNGIGIESVRHITDKNGGACDFTYKVFDIQSLTGMDVDVPTTTDIQMNVGQKKTLTFSAQNVNNSASDIVSLSAAKEVPGATANKATDVNYSGDSVSVKRALYTFTSTGTEYTIAHAGMYLSVGTNGKAGYPGASTAANVTLRAVDLSLIHI